MIIPVKSPINLLLATVLPFLLLPPHHPRHHNILLISLAPPPSAAFLLQRPDVHERPSARPEVLEDGRDCFGAPLGG